MKILEVRVWDDGSLVYEYKFWWGESIDNFNLLVEDFYCIGCIMIKLSIVDEFVEGEG